SCRQHNRCSFSSSVQCFLTAPGRDKEKVQRRTVARARHDLEDGVETVRVFRRFTDEALLDGPCPQPLHSVCVALSHTFRCCPFRVFCTSCLNGIIPHVFDYSLVSRWILSFCTTLISSLADLARLVRRQET